ncbi:MAG: DNA alkylation repair protein [Prolixibacteraceae bacterium]
MNANTLRNEIVFYCEANADEAIVKKYAIYFKDGKNGYDAYGISTALIQSKIKELNSDPAVTLQLLLEAAPTLLKSGKYEETFFILLLMEKHLKELTTANFDEIAAWYDYGIINWAQCDTLCNKIIPWFFLHQLVPLSSLAAWQGSPHRFKRRSVAVPLIKLLKSTDDYKPFFDLITPIMMDQERVVHQGLGWFLREAWKKQPQQTEQFLMQWKDRSPRLIFQYATERMSKDDRERFRKSK